MTMMKTPMSLRMTILLTIEGIFFCPLEEARDIDVSTTFANLGSGNSETGTEALAVTKESGSRSIGDQVKEIREMLQVGCLECKKRRILVLRGQSLVL
ncbi:hypothetical protein J1N35_046122 [Gossypium stocksii]|uniref:Uncharacterized protein n=1 Tax=Gossypium stocksii TaxID=47602 RepID=A0A9D3U5H3_9ROSI|nr:hypothetical protein J1N35_046122 [Gossypium stocksii]